jgi:hypothetical protein
LPDVSEVLTAIIVLVMEAVSTSEMSVSFNVATWHNILEHYLEASMQAELLT